MPFPHGRTSVRKWKSMVLFISEHFSHYECPGLLLCSDVLCTRDFWREEMDDLR